jgi:hypothetical protein
MTATENSLNSLTNKKAITSASTSPLRLSDNHTLRKKHSHSSLLENNSNRNHQPTTKIKPVLTLLATNPEPKRQLPNSATTKPFSSPSPENTKERELQQEPQKKQKELNSDRSLPPPH